MDLRKNTTTATNNFKGKRMLARAEDIPKRSVEEAPTPVPGELKLFNNIQFIYELELAHLELDALGIKYEHGQSLKDFAAVCEKQLDKVKKASAYFQLAGGAFTDYHFLTRKNQTNSVNQYLTHWIYPYKGKFHPQMIRALYNIIGLKPGDSALDPFIGSGTAALEAMLLGINFIGVDVSPLCVLQSRVKTGSAKYVKKIRDAFNSTINDATLTARVSTADLEKAISELKEERVREFYQMAYLVALSDEARRGRNFQKAFGLNAVKMIKSIEDMYDVIRQLQLKTGEVTIVKGDARNLQVEEDSIDGIVTSPPYSIALDYVANDSHALSYLGHDLKAFREEFIGVKGKPAERVQLYNEDMVAAYSEMYRVLRPGGKAAIVIGDATLNGEAVKTIDFTIRECENLGFKLERVIDKIIFGLYNVMLKENIVIVMKPKTHRGKRGEQ